MHKFKSFFLIFFISLLISCAKDQKEVSIIQETRQDLEMVSAYKEASFGVFPI